MTPRCGLLLEGLSDGGVELTGGEALEQAIEPVGKAADVAAALGDELEQPSTVRCDVVQPIERAMLASLTFGVFQAANVLAYFDLFAAVPAARVHRDGLLAIEHVSASLEKRGNLSGPV